MRLVRLLLCLAAFLAAPVAFAQSDKFPDREFGSWQFYATGGSCWLVNEVPGGEIAFSSSGTSGSQLFLQTHSTDWPKYEPRARFPVTLTLGRYSITHGGGTLAIGNGFGVTLPERKGGYFDELRAADTISLTGNGQTMELPLDGGKAAIDLLQRCAEAIGE